MSNEAHIAKLNQKREERKQQAAEDTPLEKREVVMHGAKLKCQYAQGQGKLVVTSNELQLQDQLWATKGDGNNMVNLQFQGTCGHPKWPQRKMSPPPCMSVIKLTPWQNLGTTIVQEQTVLVKESFINCDPEFNAASPSPIPVVASIKGDSKQEEKIPTILDAYFVKLEKTKPAKKGEKGSVSTTKVTERGLSYQLAVIIETAELAGKKIKVKIKSGKRKVLSDVDAALSLIDMKDVDAVTDPAKYKGIKAKNEFEVEVGAYANDKTIANAESFKDKAVLKLMLNQRADDLSFDLAELIMADAEQKAFIYIEVTSTEPKIKYKGKDDKNIFLNEEGKYLEVKYLEQPWIVTARKERKLGVTEDTHCDRIINEYHASNREVKMKGCKTGTNAWCASFVGWCLVQNKFSAQLDPGAYSYGYVNTRYRAKGKKPEYFGDPVWGQKTDGNKIAIGSICVVNGGGHVTFAIAKYKDEKHFFGLGGNQGDSVKVSAYSVRNSSVFPIEYTILTSDYELPIYYRELSGDSTS